jgi:penicillin V acylase-like amidase (Ntn superfamily)
VLKLYFVFISQGWFWRSVADLTDKTYYFENTDRPNIFWVNLNKLDLKPGAPVKKLSLGKGEIYAGDVSKDFVASKPFEMQ